MLFIEAEPAIHGIVCSTDSICTNNSLIATKSARKPQNTESQIKKNNSLLQKIGAGSRDYHASSMRRQWPDHECDTMLKPLRADQHSSTHGASSPLNNAVLYHVEKSKPPASTEEWNWHKMVFAFGDRHSGSDAKERFEGKIVHETKDAKKEDWSSIGICFP